MKRTTFDLLLTLDRAATEPLRTQLVRELREAVQQGRLPAGSSLPSTRGLAESLGVSRGLVVEAFEQLVAEGYVVARRGSATRVAQRSAQPPDRGTRVEHRSQHEEAGRSAQDNSPMRFDFRPGTPDASLFPRAAWMRALRRAFASDAMFERSYPHPRGHAAARIALAAYLNRSRATAAHPDSVLLCAGFAQGARLVAEALVARGVRRIAVEDPGHAEQFADMRAAGLELVPVPVDHGGMCVSELDAFGVGAVLVTPAHQFPTGAVLEPERRSLLLDWARRERAWILEDDYDAEYRFDRDPVGAMQGRAPDRVIYIGTASKTLAPSLRLGWLLLPPELVADVRRAKVAADRGSPVLEQAALAEFIDAGELDRHLRRTRAIYRRRRDVLVMALRTHLPSLRTRGISAGQHVMLDLAPGMSEAETMRAAALEGVRVYPARVFHADPASAPPALLLGYGTMPEADIDAAVRSLAKAVSAVSASSLPQPFSRVPS